MTPHEVPDVPVWTAVLDELVRDDRITPQLHGFISLAVPQGVMGGTLYLDVPNDLTAAQFTKRMRAPILEALTRVGQDVQDPASNFRVVVNPDLADVHLTAPIPVQSVRSCVPTTCAPWPLRPDTAARPWKGRRRCRSARRARP